LEVQDRVIRFLFSEAFAQSDSQRAVAILAAADGAVGRLAAAAPRVGQRYTEEGVAKVQAMLNDYQTLLIDKAKGFPEGDVRREALAVAQYSKWIGEHISELSKTGAITRPAGE
jgi:hypothetical protein